MLIHKNFGKALTNMHHISYVIPNPLDLPRFSHTQLISQEKKGRTSAIFDDKRQYSENCGLHQSYNRYDLLLLVKKAGKKAGFSAKMVEILDYYMAFTRETDWEEGARPIIYQSLSKTALDLGVSERQIQRLEKELAALGALTWNHSGNHRRYGQRDAKTGRILYGFGVDLTPLALLKDRLETLLTEKKQHDRAWMETKRQISWYRRQILNLFKTSICDIQTHDRYGKIAKPIRTYMDLAQLQDLLAAHRALLDDIKGGKILENLTVPAIKTPQKRPKESRTDDKNVVHIESTNQKPSDKSEHRATPGHAQKRGTGIEHIKLLQLISLMSQEHRLYLSKEAHKASWNDLTDSAFRFKEEIGISHKLWARACSTIGRSSAVICLILTDHAQRRENMPISNTGGYFNALITKGEQGRLELHKSVFSLLKRSALQNRIIAA